MRFLRAACSSLATRIGCPDRTLPNVNPTRRGDYRDYYDDELRDLVAERFAADIDAFGYRFE